jgi:hypothetical protein
MSFFLWLKYFTCHGCRLVLYKCACMWHLNDDLLPKRSAKDVTGAYGKSGWNGKNHTLPFEGPNLSKGVRPASLAPPILSTRGRPGALRSHSHHNAMSSVIRAPIEIGFPDFAMSCLPWFLAPTWSLARHGLRRSTLACPVVSTSSTSFSPSCMLSPKTSHPDLFRDHCMRTHMFDMYAQI